MIGTRERFVGGLFVVMIVLANILATKVATIPVVDLSTTAGVFPIAIAFLCTDILSENHGKQAAQQWVFTSLAILAISWSIIYIAVFLPAADSWSGQSAFASTLTASLPIVSASFITFAVSQTIDVEVFHRIRMVTSDKQRWVRNIGSTAISQLADTALFTLLAFAILPLVLGGTTLPLVVIAEIIGIEYAIKLSLAIIDTPAFYGATYEQGI